MERNIDHLSCQDNQVAPERSPATTSSEQSAQMLFRALWGEGQFECRVLDHGEWGFEAQFIGENGRVLTGQRFGTMALALQWAMDKRLALENVSVMVRSTRKTIHDTIEQVRAHYLEMPGQRLRAEEIHRLCGIEPTICQMVLDTLVHERFLCVKWDGHYVRV